MSFEDFAIFSSGGTSLAILVKGHKWSISVNLYSNEALGLGGDVV